MHRSVKAYQAGSTPALRTMINDKIKHWLNRTNGNYTHQVKNPDEFLRFDLTEGIPWFKDQLKEWLMNMPIETVIHYPSAQFEKHKQLLARWLHVKEENIALGNGSDELIEMIAQIFINQNDKVIVQAPSFFRFSDASIKAGAHVIRVVFPIQNKFEWDQDTTSFLKVAAQDNVKIIWLASPNNPTGVDIPLPVLKEILKLGKLVVLDKVLNGFTKELREASQLIWSFPNLIILSGFSKTFGLPGIRFGFAIGSPETISIINKWHLPFNISGTTLWITEHLLVQLLLKNISFQGFNNLLKEKARFESELKKISLIEMGSNSKTNFLLLRSKKINLFQALLERNILVTNLNHTDGINKQGFVRVTVRTQEENNKILDIIKNIVNQYV